MFILLTIDPLGIQEPIELCEHHTFLLQDFYDVAHLTLGGINRPKPSIYYMYLHTSEVSVHHLRPRNRMTKQYYSKGFKGWIKFYKLIFLSNYSMKLRGLPTIKHILVLLYKACRTWFLPDRFGIAGLKMGWMGETVGKKQVPLAFYSKTKKI